ncbi:hypothetical protein C7999DRAFT_14517 [Corynascus novoguineensis]|uniref:Uncharacterized protein n=1 Tax=Corynascus novoguineensis TaxID=1126955 RepID=A0AAN7CUE9_9PEZI|nr:hypothetical protein C7999DRAFT_14517 [Corynascus novoguineensis]
MDCRNIAHSEETSSQRRRFSHRSSLVIIYLIPIFATSLAIWAVLHIWRIQLLPSRFHYQQRATSASDHRWTTCGSTPEEAESRGCRFDILSFAWQTPECYDDELMEDFLKYGTWQFYAYPNRTDVVVNSSTALKGYRSLYVDWEYHVTHCTFTWRQMHRAYAERGYIDSHLDSYKHTLHCQWVLTNRKTRLGMVNVVAEIKYPECKKIEELRGESCGR